MTRLSVIIRSSGGGSRLGRCLAGVRWADQLIVVDSAGGVTAGPVAREYGAELVTPGSSAGAPPPEAGFDRATGEWILLLDGDEEVPRRLAEEIGEVMKQREPADGYLLDRRMTFQGRWIRHAGPGPDAGMRLFRRGRLDAGGAAGGGGYAVMGRTGRLSAPLLFRPSESISDYLQQMNRDTSLGVPELIRTRPGYIPGAGSLLAGPLSQFLRNYIAGAGFRDGMGGFVLAVLDSVSELALRAKLWEYHAVTGVPERPPVDMEGISAMERRYGP